MRQLFLLICLLSVTGCIERKTSASDEARDDDAASTGGSSSGRLDGGMSPSDGSITANDMMEADGEGNPNTGGPAGRCNRATTTTRRR